MARYFLRFRHSDTGLTPTFTYFKKAADLSNVSPPTLYEVTSGTYYFDYVPTEDVIFEVDGGASIPTEEVRYIADALGPKDGYVDQPVSQIKDDVWDDTVDRGAGTKGQYVESIGLPTDNSAQLTLFGKSLLYKESVRGDTAGTSDGNDVEEVYDALASAQGDITSALTALGDIQGVGFATGTDSLKALSAASSNLIVTLAGVQGDVVIAVTSLEDIKGVGFATGTDSLKAISDGIDAINVSVDPNTIADAVWDASTTGNTTGGTMGGLVNSGASLTATAIADAVWDEPVGDHLTAGSTGAVMNAPSVDYDAIADAVWDEILSGHTIPNSAGVSLLNSSGAPYIQFYSNGDTVGPGVLQVTSPTHDRIRVTFSEPVMMDTGPTGALNPNNYDVVGVTILGAVQVTPQQVLLTTTPQTPDYLYDLRISNIVDTQGNPILG